MKRLLRRCLAIAITMLLAAEARADEPPASCAAAFEAAEMHLRPSETHLLDARTALLVCAHPSCNAWMVDDCTKRLVEVTSRIPSVVFSAEDGRGGALHDVRVREGERELVSRLDGRALEIDPGPHELVAERGGARVTQTVVVTEGKKAQQVVFVFAREPVATEPTSPSLAYPWAQPLAGGLLLGGAVAGGIGVGLLARAVSKKDEARCDAQNVCDGEPLESARHAARGATAAFVVSGVLATGGVATFLLFGRTTRVQAALNSVQFAMVW